MKTNILAYITLSAALLLASCEKEIEFNGKQTDAKLVINSLVEPNEPVKAYVGKSYFFLDNNESTQAPDDVAVSLFVNGNFIGTMERHIDTVYWGGYLWDENGNELPNYSLKTSFFNDYRPQVGDVVKIVASAPGFDDVEGETSALPKTLNYSMSVEVTQWSDDYYPTYNPQTDDFDGDSLRQIWGKMDLTITINDPNPGQTDLFRLLLSSRSVYDVENRWTVSFEYDDPIFGTNLENEFVDFSDLDLSPTGVFTDVFFDGSSYHLKIKDLYFNMDLGEDYNPDFYRAPFTLEHLSKEYYNYLNTCEQGDVEFQFFTEPVQTYSNVKGGYGLVAGHTVDTLWVALPLEE